jgi:hypothetical protein
MSAAAYGLSCGGREHPPPFSAFVPSDAGRMEAGVIVLDGSVIDTDALCGDQEISALSDPPNVYFVLDRSGSMAETLPGNGYTKYENARIAISVMLRAVGHRIRYGAAVFPSPESAAACAPGQEVFPTTLGDPPSYGASGKNGPILSDLLMRLGSVLAGGGTTTASTLHALKPDLAALPGKTYVVLMTDGVPNCNPNLLCSSADCTLNIEGASISGQACDDTFNCCDPANVGPNGPTACIDSDATAAAVTELEGLGIDTYVVGMPGTERYAAFLNLLAEAGHTAQAGATAYYAVGDTTALTSALTQIGAHVAISCDIELARAPVSQKLVNVYFDGHVIPLSPDNGWSFSSATGIQIHGQACTRLAAGNVFTVRILEGCETVVP